MIKALTRFTLVAVGLLGGYGITRFVDWQNALGYPRYYVIFLLIILGGSIGYVLGGIVGRELTTLWQHAEQWVRETSPLDLILGTVGLIVGLLVAWLASAPLRGIRPEWLSLTATALLMVVCVYVGVSAATWKRREFAALLPALSGRDLAPARERAVVLDTSAIIDARFIELHRLGFLQGRLRVPRFVLAELQTLADSADDTRRARGRRGLDLLAALPDAERIDVFETDYPDTAAVDEKLMRLAFDSKASLVTVDYNLAKVARVRGIDVLNLNDAAAALRPNHLPGEFIHLRVAKQGKESEQGVGYLDDGTMVVVQAGRTLIGRDADVEVTSVLQTSAGRMIFARANAGAQVEPVAS